MRSAAVVLLTEKEAAKVKEAELVLELYLSTRAENTRRNYRSILRDWLKFQDSRRKFWQWSAYKAFLHPSRVCALEYIQELRKRGGKESTVNHKIVVLRSLYDWLKVNGYTNENPWHVPLPKAQDDSHPAEALQPEQVRQLLSCWGEDFDEKLKKAIITLLFACGLRRSELPSLLSTDVRLEQDAQITLRRQKNKKLSRLPIPEWAVPALEEYRALRDYKFGLKFAEFFLKGGKHQKPQVSDCFIKRTFKEALSRCGLPTEGYSCHSARATAITELLKAGHDHREVQEFSRHSSVRMVERYDRRRYEVSQNPGRLLKY